MSSVLCRFCKGTGEMPCESCNPEKNENKEPQTDNACGVCEGKGRVKCPYCLGFGMVDFPAIA
ncbi:MAG: hypothetical protein LWY06_14770 [Firmicutes bacterium]|nr:hypothetical protein [Bacillota bacterium]